MNPIAEKVKKLLALATSENEHESAAAMAKAAELMEQHNITQAEMGEAQKGQFTRADVDCFGDLDLAQALAVQIVCKYFHVRGVVCEGGIVGQQIAFMGREENVVVAEYVYEFLRQLFARWPKQNAVARRDTPNFQKGMYEGLREKLEAERVKREVLHDVPTANLPMVQERALLKRFAQQQFPQARWKGIATGVRARSSAYERGVEKGKEIQIRSGISSRNVARAELT